MKVTGLVFFFALMLIVERTSAFMCYTCSQASEKCIKGNAEAKASNCSSSSDDRKDMQKFCFKTINYATGKHELYNRGCLIGDSKSFCELEREKDPKTVCSICNKELCNSGSFENVSKILMLLIVAVAMFWK
ncbi:unnamed protein product [Chironomus riparius]|uniref:Protein sleepless n=1 Tax=Chironomus riparius TaxID=315576 RepID=A0A9N9RTJ2_9DIPT|nr:unnamed protein product [Chironomus riparius]